MYGCQCCMPLLAGTLHELLAASMLQDELDMTKETFRERFSDDPRKDDLTILAPKQDDPTEQVSNNSAWQFSARCHLFC